MGGVAHERVLVGAVPPRWIIQLTAFAVKPLPQGGFALTEQ